MVIVPLFLYSIFIFSFMVFLFMNVTVISGKNWKGGDCQFYMDQNLYKNWTNIKEVVSEKDFDYIALVCGLPGVGKSNFAISGCKFFCPWFDETYIASSADEFIEITNRCPRRSAVMLDESFASMNSKVGMTSEFLKIVNHLQIIRQRNLYVFLCLPNFFDLQKGIAIYRSSHLFVAYGEEFGKRGRIAAFDREKKKMLYILGSKFMNYHAVRPNFRAKFFKQTAIDEKVYDELKLKHLRNQVTGKEEKTKKGIQRNKLISYLRITLGYDVDTIANMCGLRPTAIYDAIKDQGEWIEAKYGKFNNDKEKDNQEATTAVRSAL